MEVDSAVELSGGLMVTHSLMVSLRREVVLPARFKVSGGPVGSAHALPPSRASLTPPARA